MGDFCEPVYYSQQFLHSKMGSTTCSPIFGNDPQSAQCQTVSGRHDFLVAKGIMEVGGSVMDKARFCKEACEPVPVSLT